MRYRPPKMPKKPRSNADMWVELDAATKRRWALLTELGPRMEAIARMTPFVAANTLLHGVQARMPAGIQWASYRQSLVLARVRTPANQLPTFAVHAKRRGRQETVEVDRNVIYVKPKRSYASAVPPEIRVLQRFSPWTAETLPFAPSPKRATLMVRRVSRREVQRVGEQREKDKPEWRKALADVGIRNESGQPPAVTKETKVVSDLAFNALRLEFGYGGTRATPHWRPALKETLNYVQSLFRRRSFFTGTLTDARSRLWRKWPPRVESSIKIETLRDFQNFQRRVRV